MRMINPQAVVDARAWLDQRRADLPTESREQLAELVASVANFAGWIPAPQAEQEGAA